MLWLHCEVRVYIGSSGAIPAKVGFTSTALIMSDPLSTHPLAGLVSVSFRKHSPREIVQLVSDSGLDGIEWGGDIHAPHGDIQRAREIRRMVSDAGLRTLAYGSYYKLGVSEASGLPFRAVLESAVALGAPIIRVWAGEAGSDKATAGTWDAVRRDAERVAVLAAESGVKVGLEFHGGTLNDTPEAARRLWKELEHPNLHSLWQPLVSLSAEEKEESLRVVLPRICHVHVFHWLPSWERRPLIEGVDDWRRWLGIICKHHPGVAAMLEFLRDDDPDHLAADARTLKEVLCGLKG